MLSPLRASPLDISWHRARQRHKISLHSPRNVHVNAKEDIPPLNDAWQNSPNQKVTHARMHIDRIRT